MLRMNALSVQVFNGHGWVTHTRETMPSDSMSWSEVTKKRDRNPISPPSSPREAVEDDEEDWDYYEVVEDRMCYGNNFYKDHTDIYMMNKKRLTKNIKRQTKIKRQTYMRRNGSLKQPGGASCDQRR